MTPHALRAIVPMLALSATLTAMAPLKAMAAPDHPGPPLTIQRAQGEISIDGQLGDPGWQGVPGVTTWYETRVSDSGEPAVRNVGYLAFDDRYLYAAFEFDDPQPKLIRAPIADHDQLSGTTDYGGVLIDSHNDGKSAVMFLANANGLQYDAISNDASGEDSSPDFYWESAGRITERGWTLEIRVPFSSLRYARTPSPTWGVMLYRNYPRDQHYQFFTAKLPRNSNCFICNESALTGLDQLPHGSNMVVAPYATSQRLDSPRNEIGTPLAAGKLESEAGGDLKWSPLASVAIDATVNPDFSQVEADIGQIAANERFALFYPEKRSFFLEGIDLFSTPLQAVHTRSINHPDFGARVTGRTGHTSFTALGARDHGDGQVILPGPEGSGFADQDFESDVGIVRMRHDLGRSAVGLLTTGRTIRGGGHNAVFGPDARWQPKPTDTFAAQALWSDSRTPNRPELASEWDGRRLADRALLGYWSHNSRTTDVYIQGQDLGADFRADEGFIPQVGYREVYVESGYTMRSTKSIVSRLRLFTANWYDADLDGRELSERMSVGAGMDGRWNSFVRIELNRDRFRAGSELFTRFRPRLQVQTSPTRMINDFSLDAYFGEEIDFANARKGTGATLVSSVTVRPNDHLELSASTRARWINVDDPVLGSGRLFLAQVQRLRSTWSFNSHAFVRLIGQYERNERAASLYTFAIDPFESHFDASALVGYKLNWQTVLYLGYGDQRAFAPANGKLVPGGRQTFAKVSYAVQV